MRLIAGLAGAAALAAGAAFALSGGAEKRTASAPMLRPVAVELFTSQGCSSCPPADALAGKLARDANIVMITRPVTYWDRLGWKDTLGREANTQLQRRYAARGGAGAGVYTPQMVVQGGDATVGSRERAVRRLVAAAGAASGPSVRVSNGAAEIDGATAGPATVSVVALRSRASVAIGAGENGGRRVDYFNVVLDERPIGRWRGGRARFALPAVNPEGADRHALIVQRDGAGEILAARYY